ncbi:hypothetical protein HMPREF2990_02240 [Corynebacterium sp. HMSC071B10]|nr:hypothetical protein HMPREF2990_02240 [Corynebacterium sp. HMSC071B10]
MHIMAGAHVVPRELGVPINHKFSLPGAMLREPHFVAHAARHHPRGIAYPVPATDRAVAHALAYPGTTVTGMGALALYGLPFLADSCDTVLLGRGIRKNRPATELSPALWRRDLRAGETWTVMCAGQPISVASPPVAVVDALVSIRRGECAWPAPSTCVRAVQLIDATRRFCNLNPESIRASAFGRLDRRWLSKVLGASSALADSPKETEMRLLAAPLARKHGLTLAEQVVIRNAWGKRVTDLDLALVEPRIGLMYDGAHHWDKQQRTRDSVIQIELVAQGWQVLRFAEGTLARLPEAVEEVLRRSP